MPEGVNELAEKAEDLYRALSQPRGIISEISLVDFQAIYEGDGVNTSPAPLPEIAGNADRLALFAGAAGIHSSENEFPFCLDCATWECRDRIATITQLHPTDH